MADLGDLIRGVTDGGRPLVTTLASKKLVGDTTLTCAALTGWETSTAVDLAIYTLDAQGEKVAGSQTDWVGVVSGSTITIEPTPRAGTDQEYLIGATVECMPTAAWGDDIAKGILVHANTDGTLKDNSVDTPQLQDSSVVTAKLATGAATDDKWRNGVAFYAYKNTNQTGVSAATFTAISLQAELYDFGDDFDTSTGIFTAPYAGAYNFTGCVAVLNDSVRVIASIYKNGVEVLRGTNGTFSGQANRDQVSGDLLLAQGDQIRLYAFRADAGTISAESTHGTFLCGHLISKVPV